MPLPIGLVLIFTFYQCGSNSSHSLLYTWNLLIFFAWTSAANIWRCLNKLWTTFKECYILVEQIQSCLGQDHLVFLFLHLGRFGDRLNRLEREHLRQTVLRWQSESLPRHSRGCWRRGWRRFEFGAKFSSFGGKRLQSATSGRFFGRAGGFKKPDLSAGIDTGRRKGEKRHSNVCLNFPNEKSAITLNPILLFRRRVGRYSPEDSLTQSTR